MKKFKQGFFMIAMLVGICIYSLLHAQEIKPKALQKDLAELEATTGGRIGLYAIDTGNYIHFGYRAKERFPMCSTAKLMVVSAILKKSILNQVLLQRNVIYQKKDLVAYSPMTEKHIKTGMRISD